MGNKYGFRKNPYRGYYYTALALGRNGAIRIDRGDVVRCASEKHRREWVAADPENRYAISGNDFLDHANGDGLVQVRLCWPDGRVGFE